MKKMNDKELWKLISIISEGQDSEQRRKVEQYITDLQREIERLNNIINELEKWLADYIKLFDEPDMLEEQTCEDLKEVLDKLQELKGDCK